MIKTQRHVFRRLQRRDPKVLTNTFERNPTSKRTSHDGIQPRGERTEHTKAEVGYTICGISQRFITIRVFAIAERATSENRQVRMEKRKQPNNKQPSPPGKHHVSENTSSSARKQDRLSSTTHRTPPCRNGNRAQTRQNSTRVCHTPRYASHQRLR